VEVFVHDTSLSLREGKGKGNRFELPISPAGESPIMQITVTISDAIVREAAARSLPVIDFVESLIDKGMLAASEPPVFDSAIERIRRLRSGTPASRQ